MAGNIGDSYAKMVAEKDFDFYVLEGKENMIIPLRLILTMQMLHLLVELIYGKLIFLTRELLVRVMLC